MDNAPLSSAPLQISASALIATLHQQFTNTQYRALRIDSTSAIYLGPNIEEAFISTLWDHAHERAEDQTLLIMPTHPASTTVFYSAVSAFPNANPMVGQALNVLTPFLTALTKQNISTRFHNGLAVKYSLGTNGDIISSRIQMPQDPFSSLDQLLKLPQGDRVFDVFYHLLLAESDRAQHLSLKSPQEYDLLKNGTYTLPDWVTFSDDHALAKDWSDGLRQCGIKGVALRGVLSTLSGILLLGNKSSIDDQQEGCALIGLDPDCLNSHSVEQLISSAYTTLVENVVAELNSFLSLVDDKDATEDDVIAVVSIVECASSSKATILRNVFDNTCGINAELNEDGVQLTKTPAAITRTLSKLDSSVTTSTSTIENFRGLVDSSISYLADIRASPDAEPMEPLVIDDVAASSRIWNMLNVSSCGDAESQARDVWSSQIVSAQVREYFVTEWANKRRNIDFSVDFGLEEFFEKYNPIMPPNLGLYDLESWGRQERNWGPQDFFCGSTRVRASEGVWRELEMELNSLDNPEMDPFANPPPGMYPPQLSEAAPVGAGAGAGLAAAAAGGILPVGAHQYHQSADTQYPEYNNPFEAEAQSSRLLQDGNNNRYDYEDGSPRHGHLRGGYDDSDDEEDDDDIPIDEEYLKKYHGDMEHNLGQHTQKEEIVEMTSERKAWVWFVWMLTFWIPSPFLNYVVRMKRREVRMAWREKLVICFLIALLNGGIIFYMIFLGTMICPDYDKVWNLQQIGTHQGDDDFYVAIHGNVYDITHFYRQQHSDTSIKTTPDLMIQFAGQDLSDYFLPPLTVACPSLVDDDTVYLSYNTTKSPLGGIGDHKSGKYLQSDTSSKLYQNSWYNDRFKPKIKEYYKGKRVETKSDIEKKAKKDSNLVWAVIDDEIYDISNYMTTIQNRDASVTGNEKWNFLDSKVVNMFQNNAGKDITEEFHSSTIDPTTRANTMECLKNTFHAGSIDFRNSAKCQASNVILLVIAGILTSVTLIKFLTSIKFGGKKVPSPQDKFVVCQIPAYTESEDALRLAVDSLTSMNYENSRKLLFVICDGMIVGAGNDRPTPRIVLDLFGVDDRIDPPTKPYLAIGEGGNRLNYAKVYSGLYEFEGNTVPYMVVVKVGRPAEVSRPGNRGKRDSQIMLMNFFNRVHYQTPMTPLELEIFHQMNNVIGVDPELYEYIMMVDADTSVEEHSLTRLVAECANDSKVAGTCGETALQNEEQSWATMMQVYEYFISHHLTKAFESLFGTVTCLPGCFSLYRMRTAKKFKPLIISNDLIRDYSICNVDTLHKKNLFSLGEDRYLTTLVTKYFPKMKLTFVAEAIAFTAAPDEFKVLLSQRRRWINSTVHNLVELLRLNNMCGFFFFGMRGVVFIDLVGTMMLPSVVVYLVYLIYRIAAHVGPLPIISIVLIASVYGLQALVFVLRRQWQHIGWMIIYLAAYPVHSFLLPIYSFWNMDNFTWGNTRRVVGEKNGKQKLMVDDEGFDPSSVELETWRSYAMRNGFKGAERPIIFDERKGRLQNQVYDEDYGYEMEQVDPRKTIYDVDQQSRMDGVGSIYSEARSRPFSVFSGDRLGGGASRHSMMSGLGGLPASQSRMSLATARMSTFGNDMGDMHSGMQRTIAEEFNPEQTETIRGTIQRVLDGADLDNMTKRELRERVEDIMDVKFTPDRVPMVDRLIDEELEKLEDDLLSDVDTVDELNAAAQPPHEHQHNNE